MPTDAITRHLNEIESLQTESARSRHLAQLLHDKRIHGEAEPLTVLWAAR